MPTHTPVIREAAFPADTVALVAVIREYVRWLDMDLSYRGFDAEMDAFERIYTLPSGMFFVAEADGEIAGCAGLLRRSNESAELKRLYVREAWRGLSLGEKLVMSASRRAKTLGFSTLVLDAVPQTRFAQHLYERLGFAETAPFYENPVEGTRFMALAL
ncbi:GNAT family N-acetyltransferase [Burkholderia ubonensis]|uniref:GNAT family N-acetyltransferase n=1 Tax=Burkholderia ubonensis subsp. mesacidophila TaxID=265293 RepID=A0A2A4FDN0_9BURK|nr:GNAT family N-acetyltransferase [Burkholderia ubonensis]PCE30782.1 GNAT family N-acetyltransferase [Burkholderia ubonensis subsp. mesacidophila]